MYDNTKKMIKEVLRILKQPPLVSVLEWANLYRVLDTTSAKEVGKFNVERTPYMVEIYEKITNAETKQVSLMMAAQLAKSELIINIMLRYAHLEPCPMLVVQPTDEMGRSFSKERIQPAINNSILSTIIKEPSKKDSGNTVTHKMFPGGFIAIVGANSPSKLAARPIRIIFCDEVDRYPKSSGNEGSPISLAKKRTSTFDDITKHIITGTPTIKGSSEIEDEYNNSTQAEWYVPCPSCGTYQTYKWGNIKYDDKGKNIKMLCSNCGKDFTEKEWKKGTGKWVHKHPEKKSNLGYKLSALASPFRGWDSIVEEWREIKDDTEKLKAFINTVLAETFEQEYQGKLDAKKLFKRTREKYNYLPDKALILTAGVDIQDGWIAIEVVAWGLGYESWGIKFEILRGNMEQDDIWDRLDKFLDQEFYFMSGEKLKIFATCIDTGGHFTQKVYDFISPRQNSRMIIGIKGMGGDNVPINNGFRATKNNEIDLLSVGSNALKDIVIARLDARVNEQSYCHFNGLQGSGYDLEYFKSLTAEIKVQENKKVVWKKIQTRNEGFDCRCYATIPFYISSIEPEKLSELSREQLYLLSLNKQLKDIQPQRNINSKGVEVW